MALDISAKNVSEAASILGVSIGRVHQLIREKRLAAIKVSERCWLIELSSIEEYRRGDRSPGRRPVQKS